MTVEALPTINLEHASPTTPEYFIDPKDKQIIDLIISDEIKNDPDWYEKVLRMYSEVLNTTPWTAPIIINNRHNARIMRFVGKKAKEVRERVTCLQDIT